MVEYVLFSSGKRAEKKTRNFIFIRVWQPCTYHNINRQNCFYFVAFNIRDLVIGISYLQAALMIPLEDIPRLIIRIIQRDLP